MWGGANSEVSGRDSSLAVPANLTSAALCPFQRELCSFASLALALALRQGLAKAIPRLSMAKPRQIHSVGEYSTRKLLNPAYSTPQERARNGL